jgi:dihydrofolate reductase
VVSAGQGADLDQLVAEQTAEGKRAGCQANGERHHDHRQSLRCDELEAMLIYSMSVSVDGFIADREGAFGWSVPSEEQFRFHLAQVRELGGYLCGRRLYETMLVWDTDPSLRDNELGAAFADVWCAIPKVVFSRTLDSVQGNARLAEASVAEEVAAALDATGKDVSIGGAGLAAAAAAGQRRRPAGLDRDQDVRLAGDL